MNCQGCGIPIPPSRGGRPRKWCSERCRKRQYAGTCKTCGAPTNGYDGPGTASDYCKDCAYDAYRTWTKETVLAAIHRFHQRYGRPPLAQEWHVGHRYFNAEVFRGDGDYPTSNTVYTVFGSFNAAITEAGYTPCPVGSYSRNPRPGDLRKVAA